jgi:6-phosphogluconolactonase (cycloisomerase 2 family)
MKKTAILFSFLAALLIQPICCFSSVLTKVGSFETGSRPIYVTYSPRGSFAAVANNGDGTVSVYKVNQKSGKFTEVQDSPFSSGAGPAAIAYSPDERHAVVTNYDASSITLFKVDTCTGAFSLIQTLRFATNPEILAPSITSYSPDGRFVAVINTPILPANSNISVYNVHPVNGTLSLAATPFSLANFSPSVLDFSPDGKFIAVTLPGLGNQGTRLKIDPVTGALSSPSNFNTSTTLIAVPIGVAYSHNGKFAAVANNFDNSLATYVVNPVTGHFFNGATPTTVPTGNKPLWVAFSPDDLMAIVTNQADQTLSVYCINQETGVFTPMGAFLTDLQNLYVDAFHPCKNFFAVVGADSNLVNVYKVDSSICQ